MNRPRSWTDEQFRRAAANSSSLHEMADRLGLSPQLSGGTWSTLRRHARRLEVTLPVASTGAPRTWTDEQFLLAAADASSMKQMTRALGLWYGGPTNRVLHAHAARLNVTLPGPVPASPRKVVEGGE